MTKNPNYRVAVEMIIKKDNKILVAKRAKDSGVTPGCWEFPAGKVEYTEIPTDAAIREAKEETNFDVKIIKQLDCRTAIIKKHGEDAYRLFFTYLLEPNNNQELILNHEHSDFKWLDKNELFAEENSIYIPKHAKSFLDKIFD